MKISDVEIGADYACWGKRVTAIGKEQARESQWSSRSFTQIRVRWEEDGVVKEKVVPARTIDETWEERERKLRAWEERQAESDRRTSVAEAVIAILNEMGVPAKAHYKPGTVVIEGDDIDAAAAALGHEPQPEDEPEEERGEDGFRGERGGLDAWVETKGDA